jgi:AcrR family transcriptional regulator
MRITKDRETRKAELVDASTKLFLEKGYDSTMVSDIVRLVGVAQGTFYYYFQTKEEVLDAALERLLREGVDRVVRLTADEYQTPAQRLEGFFRMLFSPRGSIEVSSRYSRFLQDPSVHERMEQVRFGMLHKALTDLLEAGSESGGGFAPFKFPSEIAEITLRGAAAFMHGRQAILEAQLGADATMDALAEFMERLLGLPENSLDFKDKVIKRMHSEMDAIGAF